MSNSWTTLKKRKGTVKALQEILENSDPASGISFNVRQGVMESQEDPDDCSGSDEVRRPIISVEFGCYNLAKQIVELMIQGVTESIELHEKIVVEDIKEAQKELNDKLVPRKGDSS